MEIPSQNSRLSRSKNIEEYSNSQELTSDVEALKNDNFLLAQTTEVFERYLKKRSPISLVGVDKFMEQTSSLRSTMFSLATPRTSLTSNTSPTHSASPSCLTSHSIAPSSISAYRISPLFKIDMIDREMDEGKIKMDKLQRRFKSAMFLLETEEENLRLDLELLEALKVAFGNFIKENTDKKTGRVVRERFLRFLEGEVQNGDRDLRKLKLKTKTTQIEYNRLLARLDQRLELRERLHPVDLDKLMIENEELQLKLEQKTRKILDLKKTIGKKGQHVVLMKSKLNDTLLSLGSIKHDIKQKETKYKFTEKKEIKNVNELVTAEIIHQNMKQLNSTFKSPDAHSYLMVQVRLNDLRSEKEVWERRCKYQRQTIALLEHQLRQLCPPPLPKSKDRSSRSFRTSRSLYSSKSADSMVRHFSRASHPIPHCTPTTPTFRKW